MVFAGSVVDFSRLDSDDAWLVTGIRIAAALGMLGAWILTGTAWVQKKLQLFIGVGTVLIHLVWLATVPVVESRIGMYQGVLPTDLSPEQLGHDFGSDARQTYMYGRAATIYGGSNEVQKNIIAKAVLGL